MPGRRLAGAGSKRNPANARYYDGLANPGRNVSATILLAITYANSTIVQMRALFAAPAAGAGMMHVTVGNLDAAHDRPVRTWVQAGFKAAGAMSVTARESGLASYAEPFLLANETF
jgi:hypothetical protein